MEKDDFAIAQQIRQALLSCAGQINCYDNWTDEYSRKELAGTGTYGWRRHISPITVTQFSKDQCDTLNFGYWSTELPIRLIPIWLYQHLKTGQELTSISGEKRVVTDAYQKHTSLDYIDNDNRFGMIAWGFIPTT